MDNARNPFNSYLRRPGAAAWRMRDPEAQAATDGDAELVRGPGRERHLRTMRENHTARFVVAPHRDAWGSGIWSVRRDSELLAVHPSQWEAMLDATERAYAEWSAHGGRALVEFQEMDGRLMEARVFGVQRAEPRIASPVVLSAAPNRPH